MRNNLWQFPDDQITDQHADRIEIQCDKMRKKDMAGEPIPRLDTNIEFRNT